jgi:hypothetical protein
MMLSGVNDGMMDIDQHVCFDTDDVEVCFMKRFLQHSCADNTLFFCFCVF